MTDETTDYTDRLETLAELMEEEEWEKVIFDCQSLLQQIGNADDGSNNATLRALLLEIQAKSLLQQDEWQQVIDLNSKSNAADSMLPSLAAYAQYRLGNYTEAKQLAANDDDDDLSRHVLAQCLYRLGQTNEGNKVYSNLLEQEGESDEGRMQILTNALAVRNANAHPIPSNSSNEDEETLMNQASSFLQESSGSDEVSYEYYDLAYNFGTLQILAGQAAEGRATLQATERSVQDEWADSKEDEEYKKELLPIQTNLQWSLQLQGEAPASNSKDFVSKLNAGNKIIPMKDIPANVTPLQRRVYHYNQALLSLKSKQPQLPLVKLHCMSLSQSFNTKKKNGVACPEETWWKARIAVLEAQVLEQQQKPQEAKKHVQSALNALNGSDDYQSQAWLQLHMARLEGKLDGGDAAAKLKVLEALPPSIVQSRAMVATRAALYDDVPKDLFVKEQDAADFYLSQGDYEKAAAYFSKHSDEKSRAKYALCLSYTDAPKALKIWNELGFDEDDIAPSSAGNTASMTGEELEQLPLPRVKSSAAATAAAAAAASNSKNTNRKSRESVMKKRAKQREAHVAKLQERGLDTTRPPNPERWIPKYERSKNRKRGQHKGAQGGFTEKDAAKYDVAAKQANGGIVQGGGPSTAHMTVVSDGNGGRRRRR